MAGTGKEDPRVRIREIADDWDHDANGKALSDAVLDVWPVESAEVDSDGDVWIQPLGSKGRYLSDEDLAALPDALKAEGYEL